VGVLFAVFGLVFLAFAVIAALVGTSPAFLLAHLGLGGGFLLYALATSFGELLELAGRGVRSRGSRYQGNVAVQTIVAVGILVMVAYLSVRNPVQWDWTEAKTHSLSTASRDVLAQIPADGSVELIAFYTAGSEEQAKRSLDRYPYESERVKLRYADPQAEPALAQKHDVRANGVILVCNGACDTSKGVTRTTSPEEEQITRAIRSVISTKRKVYFLEGHGEAAIEDAEAKGASRLKLALEDENVGVEKLLLANQEKVPDDADAVIVLGPTNGFLDRELDALDRYLKGGGGLFVLYDPFHQLNLTEKLVGWGVEVGNDVIVDQQIQLFAGPTLGVQPVVNRYGTHKITEDMGGRPTLYNLARSMTAKADGPGTGTMLAETGPASWAEKDVDRLIDQSVAEQDEAAGDRRGPISLAVAVELPKAEGAERAGRLVAFGDSDFAKNRYIAELFNADMAVNSVNWLVGEEQFISIERNLPRASRAAMTFEQFSNFRYVSLFVLPELLILLGVGIWWSRRT
jgi:ABC-type uncharacterized transport system involved in gliding motility auxiliary subunit